MAVVRRHGFCKSCRKTYLFRVGVGVEKNCVHTFDCVECHLPISINILSTDSGAIIQAHENCLVSNNENEPNALVMNLHPSFAIDKGSIHNLMYFASHDYMFKIYPHMRQVSGPIQDIALQFELPNCQNLWAIVRNLITLSSTSKKEVIDRQTKQYESMRRKYYPSFAAATVEQIITSFFHDMFYPKIDKILIPSLTLLSEIKAKHNAEYVKFLAFYRNEIAEENRHRYISIFSDYFRNHEQFRQLLAHARIDEDDVDNRIVGSKRFEEIKLYYGQAFETLTTHYTTLACLNNINEGRTYDGFKSMTLGKYRKDVEKANRSNPFKDNKTLFAFCDYEDSTLRNGSHHASIWRDGEVIHYRSGGSGAERDITYTRYIHNCNGITIALAALFILEMNIN